jgi:hypothetical protein
MSSENGRKLTVHFVGSWETIVQQVLVVGSCSEILERGRFFKILPILIANELSS